MPTHQCQRWKVDMLRCEFTAFHRPEYMLCECNLLSRYNQHADKLRDDERLEVLKRNDRIEAKLKQGMSPNKGTNKLAEHKPLTALIACLDSGSPLSRTMSAHQESLKSYEYLPGFSNVPVACV